ncbi:MAG: FAD-binding oxidoreductase, partial [Halomonas sp.]
GVYEELAGLLIELEAKRYHEFERRPGGWRGPRDFRIAATRQESAVIRSFVLEPVDGGPVADHAPGQYIGVRLTLDGEPLYRHYSLSALPNGRSYRISVKREPEGRASRHLHDAMGVGDTLALPPAGDLTLYEGDEPLLLASGGVGQTPLLPMARQALAQGRRMVYLHAALDPDHHAFRDEVAALAEAHQQRLRTVTVHERGDDADHVGRVDRELLAHYLPAGGRCYFVGPQGFMTVVDRALEALGVPAERRHYEHFGPARHPSPPAKNRPRMTSVNELWKG